MQTMTITMSVIEVKVLNDLFDFLGTASDVDAAQFRVRHEGNFQTIDGLKNVRLICESMGRYRLSIFALQCIKSPCALKVLSSTEPLYRELQAHYRLKLNQHLSISSLANLVNMDLALVQKTLRYMTDIPWCSGYSNNFLMSVDATVCVGESILNHKSFSLAMEEAGKWAVGLPKNHMSSLELRVNPPLSSVRAITSSQPDWHRELGEPFNLILRELYESKDAGHLALPTLGVRTILDLVCSKFNGDVGTFEAKLKLAKKNGYLTEIDYEVLRIAFDAGSAVAHRGHIGDRENLDRLIEVMEHVLFTNLRIAGVVEKIRSETPQRTRAK